jgi:hypothetical protein
LKLVKHIIGALAANQKLNLSAMAATRPRANSTQWLGKLKNLVKNGSAPASKPIQPRSVMEAIRRFNLKMTIPVVAGNPPTTTDDHKCLSF